MSELSRINKAQYKLVKVKKNQTDDIVSDSDILFQNDILYNECKIQKDMSFISDLDID